MSVNGTALYFLVWGDFESSVCVCRGRQTHTFEVYTHTSRKNWRSALQCVWQMKMRPCLCVLAPGAVNQHRAHMAKRQPPTHTLTHTPPHTHIGISIDITQMLAHTDLALFRLKQGQIYDES